MTDALETIKLWRAEIAQELAKAEAELATATERTHAAQTAQTPIRELFLGLRRALEPLQGHRRAAIASPLLDRVHAHRRALERQSTELAQATNAVAAAERRRSELHLAIQQIDQIVPQADAPAVVA